MGAFYLFGGFGVVLIILSIISFLVSVSKKKMGLFYLFLLLLGVGVLIIGTAVYFFLDAKTKLW